ncbi:MAG: outer membrane beta-barrel protein [Chitinophagaceae bacterium]|nr:outer membrane beta-barrel protein [Chitinophagaceae bacterium]
MKKLIVLLSLFPLVTGAQNLYLSARLGMANYQGDLKAKSVSFKQSKLMGSLGARYDFSEHISARSYLTLTSLAADDKNGNAFMQERNLSFRTKIFDWELTGQYSLFSFNNKWWSPYVFAGIGLYHFKPYTQDANGNKVFLQPLSTEGQGFIPGKKNYKLTQFSIPFGVGAEYSMNEDMRVGLEFGYRKIFNDYLDDVSATYVDEAALLAARGQTAVDLAWRGDEKTGAPYPAAGTTRGNDKLNDGYFYIGFTYSIRLVLDKYKDIAGIPSGKKAKRSGCPASRY